MDEGAEEEGGGGRSWSCGCCVSRLTYIISDSQETRLAVGGRNHSIHVDDKACIVIHETRT